MATPAAQVSRTYTVRTTGVAAVRTIRNSGGYARCSYSSCSWLLVRTQERIFLDVRCVIRLMAHNSPQLTFLFGADCWTVFDKQETGIVHRRLHLQLLLMVTMVCVKHMDACFGNIVQRTVHLKDNFGGVSENERRLDKYGSLDHRL